MRQFHLVASGARAARSRLFSLRLHWALRPGTVTVSSNALNATGGANTGHPEWDKQPSLAAQPACWPLPVLPGRANVGQAVAFTATVTPPTRRYPASNRNGCVYEWNKPVGNGCAQQRRRNLFYFEPCCGNECNYGSLRWRHHVHCQHISFGQCDCFLHADSYRDAYSLSPP